MSMLLTHWKKSLDILRSVSSLKLFVVLSLNTALRGYKEILLHLMPLFFVINLCLEYCFAQSILLLESTSMLRILLFINSYFFVLMCAAVRPSIRRKNVTYYAHLSPKLLCAVPAAIVAIVAAFNFSSLVDTLSLMLFADSKWVIDIWAIYSFVFLFLVAISAYFCTSVFLFSIFFMLDAPGMRSAFAAYRNGFVCTWYNLPICFLLVTWYMALLMCGRFAWYHIPSLWKTLIPKFVANSIGTGIFWLLFPAPLAFFVTYYTKRVHEQLSWYVQK